MAQIYGIGLAEKRYIYARNERIIRVIIFCCKGHSVGILEILNTGHKWRL